MKWWNEFWNLVIKCERIGHVPQVKKVRIRKLSHEYRVIAEDFNADVTYCRRCGERISDPENLEYITYYNSVTMPEYKWEEIRNNGYIICSC